MAKITWEPGDRFSSASGLGMVLSSGDEAILFAKGSRMGMAVTRVLIPEDAVPLSASIAYEVKFAMDAVCVAQGISLPNG